MRSGYATSVAISYDSDHCRKVRLHRAREELAGTRSQVLRINYCQRDLGGLQGSDVYGGGTVREKCLIKGTCNSNVGRYSRYLSLCPRSIKNCDLVFCRHALSQSWRSYCSNACHSCSRYPRRSAHLARSLAERRASRRYR